jgi:hypothetical protein
VQVQVPVQVPVPVQVQVQVQVQVRVRVSCRHFRVLLTVHWRLKRPDHWPSYRRRRRR